ncbi:hypothetical protein [Dokdonella sp.]|uniref:hypothetical protein n=1 Tax=Dokdonella sp. TaxID=2291710 RepID=UPI0025C2F36E|nr:hypothetical protein [Dokdonella sp.]MBX3689644.1 hypothetical protein [Dokdonella sp.]
MSLLQLLPCCAAHVQSRSQSLKHEEHEGNEEEDERTLIGIRDLNEPSFPHRWDPAHVQSRSQS